jgi:endonuclease YncB( thermonuclease family)
VVSLTDGDTLLVLREWRVLKVRLYGIDTPEKAQAFGTRTRRFASALTFRQTVSVIVHDTNRYGRLIRP